MTEHVWIYVSSDNRIEAFDTQNQALNAAADDPGDVWIEEVTLNRAQEATAAALSAEHDPDTARGETDAPSPQTGVHRRTWVSPPTLLIPDGFAVSEAYPFATVYNRTDQ